MGAIEIAALVFLSHEEKDNDRNSGGCGERTGRTENNVQIKERSWIKKIYWEVVAFLDIDLNI